MTHITLSSESGTHAIRCVGHATGSVEACAGISAICLTVAKCLGEPVKLTAEEGFFEAVFIGQEELFRFAQAGFEGICEEYGNYCKIMA